MSNEDRIKREKSMNKIDYKFIYVQDIILLMQEFVTKSNS